MDGFTAIVKRLLLCAIVALALFPDAAFAQGPMTNGQIHTGAISAAAEIDTWTFTAAQNDTIALSIGEVGSDAGFNPWIRLRNPNGVEIGSNSGSLVAQITVTAPLSGTYTVLVASGDTGNDGVGSYRLTLAQAPGAFVVAAGDEGGAMTNGADHQGSLYVGDLDQWSFQANQHDYLALSIGEILPVGPDPGFFPWIRLVSPTGVVLASASGTLVAQISIDAPLSGTYTVIVGTADTFKQATGTYRLMLARVPGAITVPSGDQGGPMTNGVNHAGSLYVGDLDTWTFQANKDEYIALSIGEPPFGEVDPGFFPWIRLVSPTGALLDNNYGARVGQISLNAPLSGTYTVIVGTADTFHQAAGNYLLTLAKIPGTVTVPDGDQGGALLTGPIHSGQILVGDLDQWTFQANKDDYIALSIGEPSFGEVDPGFFPWIRLVGPTGVLLDNAYGSRVAQISLNAPLTGTYTVIVSTADTFHQSEGSYQLTLAKAPGAYTLTAGDQGGTMANLVPYSGAIYVGDLDQWTFHATKGAAVSITITEPPFGEVDPGFFPWIRIIGPTGVWLYSEYGTNGAAVTFTPTLSGDYTVIVSTADTNHSSAGNYVLSGTGITVPGFTVTPSAGANGTISPNLVQEVPAGGTTSFTLTPLAGFTIAGVGGTCGGTLVGQVFTTAPVNAACTVIASFTPIVTFTITPSVASGGGGTITPSTPQSVTVGTTRSFTLTAAAGHFLSSVGGTCGGTLAGVVFTTIPVTANCTVIATFASLTLALNKTSLRFGAVTAGGTFQYQTAAQDVTLTQTGPGVVTWTATPSQPWLRVSPASGTGPATLSVSVAPVAGLPANGALSGAVTFTITGAANNPGPIAVALNLETASDSPFGYVDTPTDHQSGVTGAIPFTGWILDDIEVVRVMICRSAFGAEVAPIDPNCGGAAQIFVGFGVFIEGARPDVAGAFPAYPANTKAGWGFMVLTNMLPNQGNGTYAFQFYGQDREGHTLLLGTRTISCSNATATRPFGAIDTPLQGGTAAGSSFVNFGWALTQNPKSIPIDGSTITVLVDGVSVGHADYNHYRPDVAGAFPGLANSDGAVGFKILDTTTLVNGMHTLSWVVQDNAGAIDGIGSRFFFVANGVGLAKATAAESSAAPASAAPARVDAIASAPLDQTPVIGRRGWDLDGPWSQYGIGQAGRAVIRGEEIDRFELDLGERAGDTYTGYLRVGDELSTLPVGSTLRDTGSFTWAPGAGFVGTYDLLFVRWAGGHPVARREVRVILAPKGSSHSRTGVTIDAPRAQQEVDQPFLVGGWALDLDAVVGTGIDTLHVWAFPATGGAPIFLGTATYGGIRPDVAAVFGDRFRASGFGVSVQGLAAGTYDLQIFPWSNVTGGFTPPGVVRVQVK